MMICFPEKCTACNACVNICPKRCISFKENILTGTTFAVINEAMCINCGLCKKTCPQEKKVEGNKPKKCFVAWSKSNKIRTNSASGGIASELYRIYLEQGNIVVGVRMTNAFLAEFEFIEKIEQLEEYCNSKYVYSDTKLVFSKIRKYLKENRRVLFIGLPCQVAGLKNYLKTLKMSVENLLTVDIVCHGVTPPSFLKQHIIYIEKKKHAVTKTISFRDAFFGTENFFFSLKDNKDYFYQKGPNEDVYSVGYHRGISYRDNCYECSFSNLKRMGDLTISDFWSVGKLCPFEYKKENVSCILVNTDCASEVLACLVEKERIFLLERPIEEETLFEKQLQRPTERPRERTLFLNEYRKNYDFEKAMAKATFNMRLMFKLKKLFYIESIKNVLRKIISKKKRDKIKQFFK